MEAVEPCRRPIRGGGFSTGLRRVVGTSERQVGVESRSGRFSRVVVSKPEGFKKEHHQMAKPRFMQGKSIKWPKEVKKCT